MATTKKSTKKAAKKTTTKKTAAKRAKKEAKKEGAPQSRAEAEQIMMEAVTELRKNPKKYNELRRAVRAAKTDEERVKTFLQYATTDRELAGLLPNAIAPDPKRPERRNWTTVTITTVFII